MSAQQQDIDALERYFAWREEIHHTGVDDTSAAYREHLRNVEARETLAEIGLMASNLGILIERGEADERDSESFRKSVLALIPDHYKEVTT